MINAELIEEALFFRFKLVAGLFGKNVLNWRKGDKYGKTVYAFWYVSVPINKPWTYNFNVSLGAGKPGEAVAG